MKLPLDFVSSLCTMRRGALIYSNTYRKLPATLTDEQSSRNHFFSRRSFRASRDNTKVTQIVCVRMQHCID